MSADTPPKPQTRNTPEFSVSELAGAIKRALEDGFGYVRLRGEVSGYRGPHSSGHCYFALKDDKAKIEAVVWRGVWGKLKFKPEEGMEVIATGKISSFPGTSKYQIVIDALEPAGAGALMALLEERKKKLAAEGLFEETRKRKIPFLPRVVGIVTSPTGAVIRDMLHGFRERFPARVIVWPVRVQGETSAAEVAAAIRGFNALPETGPIPRPDVLIVARGGGSLEDLWGFNEESVVRAAAASRIPLISAVGHETDWTLVDLAADARAPTPTKAAEWAVPKYSELIAETGDLGQRVRVAVRRLLEAQRTHLKAAERGLPRAEDLVALPRQRLDATSGRLDTSLSAGIQRKATRFAQIAGRLPPLRALVAEPRQRFDAVATRLDRALLTNTRAHAMSHAKLAARLSPRLIATRLERSSRRLDETWQGARASLMRIAGARRNRLERIAGRVQPNLIAARIEVKRRQLESTGKLLASLSYQSVLARGYAIIRDEAGLMVREAAAVTSGQRLEVELADGRFLADAVGDGAPSAQGSGGKPASGRGKSGPPGQAPKRGNQGSLFE